jgi:hypothetical protein
MTGGMETHHGRPFQFFFFEKHEENIIASRHLVAEKILKILSKLCGSSDAGNQRITAIFLKEYM